jgi:hypothetical protein
MKRTSYAFIGLMSASLGVVGWRLARQSHRSTLQPPDRSQRSVMVAPASAPRTESMQSLGQFEIAGQIYTVDLQKKKVRQNVREDPWETVVRMEIRDAIGAVQYRRTFPYAPPTDDFIDSWSVSARLLRGTNGAGLLITYDDYNEPSAPEQERTVWVQIFGVRNRVFGAFGPPLAVQGGQLDTYLDAGSYMSAGALGTQADRVAFKVWNGHGRLIYPVRVDWMQGTLSPAQDCATRDGVLTDGCEYSVLPEDIRHVDALTFVRLWPQPDQRSRPPMNTLVRPDSAIEIQKARVATQWVERDLKASSSQDSLEHAGHFGLADDADLWLHVRIDGTEGWIHSDEDFRALGLPEDQ